MADDEECWTDEEVERIRALASLSPPLLVVNRIGEPVLRPRPDYLAIAREVSA